MKKIIAVFAACVLAASVFVGCSKSESSSSSSAEATTAAKEETTAEPTKAEADITGAWVSTAYITADGKSYNTADYAAANGVEESTVIVSYTFDKEGKATCTAVGATVEGTYTFDGKTLQTKFTGSEPAFEYDAEKDLLSNKDATTGITSVMSRMTETETTAAAEDSAEAETEANAENNADGEAEAEANEE